MSNIREEKKKKHKKGVKKALDFDFLLSYKSLYMILKIALCINKIFTYIIKRERKKEKG